MEGARLVAQRDFQGAIATCTEAIKLEPNMAGARRTQEAFTSRPPDSRLVDEQAHFEEIRGGLSKLI